MKGTKASRRLHKTSAKILMKPERKITEELNTLMSKDYYNHPLPFITILPSKVPFDHDIWGYPSNENRFKGLGFFNK